MRPSWSVEHSFSEMLLSYLLMLLGLPRVVFGAVCHSPTQKQKKHSRIIAAIVVPVSKSGSEFRF